MTLSITMQAAVDKHQQKVPAQALLEEPLRKNVSHKSRQRRQPSYPVWRPAKLVPANC